MLYSLCYRSERLVSYLEQVDILDDSSTSKDSRINATIDGHKGHSNKS